MYCTDPMVQWTGHSTGIDWEPIVGTAGSIDKIPRTNHVGYECSEYPGCEESPIDKS